MKPADFFKKVNFMKLPEHLEAKIYLTITTLFLTFLAEFLLYIINLLNN